MGSGGGGLRPEQAGNSFPTEDHMNAARRMLGMGSLAMLNMPTLRGSSVNQVNPLHYALAQQMLMAPRPQQPLPQPALGAYTPTDIYA